ncbi:HD domain-containing protein [Ureibacillus xyleni]|uniref:HD domain-containing protein n=1 Tax=Ureibacillus xyleni TaxID=614648 RepID=A0A285S7U1_9BACL|nr:HD domain-containing phosphohydrolase [Ureibacillus xyleni]SOC03467.1 HD domain-containing protein [Ureibacillus xyleni]
MKDIEIKANVLELTEGVVLARDLFVEGRLLMKEGNFLTSRVINLLKNRNVEHVYIKNSLQQQNKTELIELSTENVTEQFFSVLAELSIEKRYGHVLKNADDIEYIKTLFIKIMQNEKYRSILNDLKKWDSYTYYHSIDVFVLSTLFAKQEGIPSLNHKAIGFLLHDIGNLYIPLSILQKNAKITHDEYRIIKKHTIEGFHIFESLGLYDLAYLAKSHHENHNGSGYPDGLTGTEMTRELEVLHLIDVYSAITMKKYYREAIGAADALTFIFRDEEKFNPQLLSRFVEFIGIYPENSIVRLSDKSYAIIKEVNEQYPLLPLVKRLDNNQLIELPINYQLTIEKMIKYNKDTISSLFNRFYEEIINENIEGMKKTYLKISDAITENEQFTKLFIPTFQILNVLLKEQKMSETRYKKITKEITTLLDAKLLSLQEQHQPTKSILFLIDYKYQHHYYLKFLQGFFLTEKFYPFIVDASTSETEVTNILNCCNAYSVYIIRDQYEPVLSNNQDLGIYYLTFNQLEQFIFSLSGDTTLTLEQSLEKYKISQNFLPSL